MTDQPTHGPDCTVSSPCGECTPRVSVKTETAAPAVVAIPVDHFDLLLTFARVGVGTLTGPARHLRSRHLDTIEKEAKKS